MGPAESLLLWFERHLDLAEEWVARLETQLIRARQNASTSFELFLAEDAAANNCTGTATVTVTDAATGLPIPGVASASVTAVGYSNTVSAFTDAFGVATLTGLFAELYVVTALATNYYGESTVITAVCNADTPAALALNAAPIGCPANPCGSAPRVLTIVDPTYGPTAITWSAGWSRTVTVPATGKLPFPSVPCNSPITTPVVYRYTCATDQLAIDVFAAICGGVLVPADATNLAAGVTTYVINPTVGLTTCSPWHRSFTLNFLAGTAAAGTWNGGAAGSATFTLDG